MGNLASSASALFWGCLKGLNSGFVDWQAAQLVPLGVSMWWWATQSLEWVRCENNSPLSCFSPLSEMSAHDISALRVKPASSRPVCPWASRLQESSLLLLGHLLFSLVFLAGTSWSSEPLNYFSSVFSQLLNCCWIVKRRAQVWGMLKSNSCPNSTLPSCSTFWEVGWAAPLRNLIY